MGNNEMQMVETKTTYRFLPTAACIGAAVSFLGLAPSVAQARDYPYCIKGEFYVGTAGDCSFGSYQQCLATASGRRAFCDVNPFYRFQEDDPAAYPDVRRQLRR